MGPEESNATERPGSWAFQLALCLLGPFFFLSQLLTILAPLPLLYLHAGRKSLNQGRLWQSLGALLGAILCFAIKGPFGAVGYLLLATLPALVLGEMLLRRKGPEKAVVGAVLAIVLGASLAVGVAKSQNIDIVNLGLSYLDTQVRFVSQKLLDHNKQEIPPETQEELQRLVANPALLHIDLPGILAASLLLLCLLPCLAIIRWNPKGFLKRANISRDYLRKWRSPDWLVWFALFCGAFQVFEVKGLTEIAGNMLKPLVLIYFFQGMSILAYFLDSFRLRGPIRVFIYGAALMFLMPMVVSFGFFDLWFNFRGRHRPRIEEKEP